MRRETPHLCNLLSANRFFDTLRLTHYLMRQSICWVKKCGMLFPNSIAMGGKPYVFRRTPALYARLPPDDAKGARGKAEHIAGAVSAYECGKRCPDLYTLRQMCLLFQCPMAVFLEEDAELPSKEDYEAIKRFGTLKPETRRILFQIIDTLAET